MENKEKLSLFTAVSIVVANMIGTGIFATTGEIAASLPSHFALLTVWTVGGLLALCGALAYGELAAAMPRSGGEYQYLARLYHPSLGFLSGFISLTAGFAAPIALSASAFGMYFAKVIPGFSEKGLAFGLMAVLTLIHSLNLKRGAAIQNVFTILKVTLILLFIVVGLFYDSPQEFSLIPDAADYSLVFSAAFAVGLIQVYFAYSGWNAAAYISGEIKNPQKNVPLALVIGTGIVLTLYVLLNFIFLRSVPLSALNGKIEVGHIAGAALFGETGGKIVAGLIAFALVSSVSSMIMAGPRVTQAIGEDFPAFALLAKRSEKGLPTAALILQLALAAVILFSGSFWDILIYIGFTLSFFALLTVAGVYILRAKGGVLEDTKEAQNEKPTFIIDKIPTENEVPPAKRYKTFGYPITPALFILLNAWMIVNTLTNNPKAGIAGLVTLAVGFIAWAFTKNLSQKS